MKINLAKRREVMERSQKLGHCICDPRRPCPCDVFRDEGICPCAGERPASARLEDFKLMDYARNAGCASKIAPADLEAVLTRLPPVEDPAVISGLAAADDAAVYRVSKDTCLVQTVDVFTPCVNEPYLFGRICAANCLSDIYATGGEPRTALSILAFPSETLDGRIMYEMLAGAMETLSQAGVALVGGHSIKDDEIKLGFAVTGTIDPAVADSLAKPFSGDLLVLTKPLGTGVLTFARQIGRIYDPGMGQAERSMATLNRDASIALREAGASACTDVTGFGLFGHLYRLARQGRVGARVFASALPAFEGVGGALADGVIPGAVERNCEYVGEALLVEPDVDEALVRLGFDAQTSGGLLIAVSPERFERLRRALAARQVPCFLIGHFVSAGSPAIHLLSGQPSTIVPSNLPSAPTQPPSQTMHAQSADSHGDCCADVFGKAAPNGSSLRETQRAFADLMRSAQAPGALDAKTKELILLSLVIQSRCTPCLSSHLARARELGITESEIDEAAWCAIVMGGAPVRAFYQQALSHQSSGGGANTER